MKWSIQQFDRLTNTPYQFSFNPDYQALVSNVSDLLDIKEVTVSGTATRLEYGTYHIVYHVHAILVLECALTLEPVDYLIDEDYDEVFSTTDDENYFLIENNTIDLHMAVWSNLLIEKPLAVTRDDAYDILRKRGVLFVDDSFDDEEN